MKRPPDLIIGEPERPYLFRWYVVPRNRWLNVYLHKIVRSDDDRALHDHPWWNVSILLRGAYREVTPRGRKVRRPGCIVFRAAKALHRLEVRSPCWSLFITGPRFRVWGFACPKGWVPYQDFIAKDGANSVIGRGCGEFA